MRVDSYLKGFFVFEQDIHQTVGDPLKGLFLIVSGGQGYHIGISGWGSGLRSDRVLRPGLFAVRLENTFHVIRRYRHDTPPFADTPRSNAITCLIGIRI